MIDNEQKEFLDSLYVRYFDILYRYCLPKCGFDTDAAANCTHQVFDIALDKIDMLLHMSDVGGWLMNTTKNCLKRHYRRKRLDADKCNLIGRLALFHKETYEMDVEEFISNADIDKYKQQILCTLSDSEYEFFHMRYEEKMSIHQIAEIKGKSDAAVKMRLYRIRLKVEEQVRNIF